MEFIVSIGVGYGEVLTGGVVALHKLAYEIAVRGYKVTIFTEPVFPHENIVVRKGMDENNLNFEFDKENTVIIPSMDWENKQKSPNVCRWALHHLNDDLIKNVDESDKIFNFGTFDLNGLKETGKLTTLDYHVNLFKNENRERNGKTCYILNKKTPKNCKTILRLLKAESLDNWKQMGSFRYLKEKFNEYEFFITFDDKSFYTVAAAMCGCKPIILQSELKPETYRELNPLQKYGVAYGINDIEWCEETCHKVRDYVNTLIKEDSKTIDNFIKICLDK
jgi:hypothetical protein